jgi:hypothetical protein
MMYFPVNFQQVMRELGLDLKLAAEAAEDDELSANINPNLIELSTVKPKRVSVFQPIRKREKCFAALLPLHFLINSVELIR